MRTDLIREIGGFSLQYKIAGDYDLLLRAHLRGVRVAYLVQPYAVFGEGGLSMTDIKRTYHDNRLVYAAKFGLSESEADYAEAKRVFPLRAVVRCLFHKDAVVRRGAWHMVKRWIADRCGMLNEEGGMRPRFAIFAHRSR